jgi:hypothetical protein
MFAEYRWEVHSSAPATELVARLQALIRRQVDVGRNLYLPPEYPKHVDESGFHLSITPVQGGSGMLLLCSGVFHPGEPASGPLADTNESGTRVEIRLRPSAGTYWTPAALGLLFGAVLAWGLSPLGIGWAVGSVALLGGTMVVLFSLYIWSGMHSCRRQLSALLGEQDTISPAVTAAPSPGWEGPRYPWWELLAAGVPLLLGSVFVWWYLNEWEHNPGAHHVPGLVAWLHGWGGKWPCVLLVALPGAAFSGAGLWKLWLRERHRAAPPT